MAFKSQAGDKDILIYLLEREGEGPEVEEEKEKGRDGAWESEGEEKGKPGLRLLFHSPHGHHLLPFQEHQQDSNWHSDPGCGNANHCATCQSQNQVFLMLDSLFFLLVHQSFFLKE